MDRVASDMAVAEAAAAPTMTSPAASHGGGGSSDGDNSGRDSRDRGGGSIFAPAVPVAAGPCLRKAIENGYILMVCGPPNANAGKKVSRHTVQCSYKARKSAITYSRRRWKQASAKL